MAMTQNPVQSIDAWQSADAETRLEVARAIASALPRGFEAKLGFIGSRGLAELVHRPSGISFALVPGGTFFMGFREDEVESTRALGALKIGSPQYRAWSASYEKAMAEAMPARSIEVRPFLCARSPILDVQTRAIEPTLVGRCPLKYREDFPDLDQTFVPDEDETDLADESEDLTLWRPSLLSPGEAVRVAQSLGMRFLRASEWEYVARDHGTQSWIAASTDTYREIARSVAALNERPVFLPGKGRDLASNELGVWALHMGEWVREGDADSTAIPVASRGGAVLSWPWQDAAEILFAHPAGRRDGAAFGQHSALRLALDLP